MSTSASFPPPPPPSGGGDDKKPPTSKASTPKSTPKKDRKAASFFVSGDGATMDTPIWSESYRRDNSENGFGVVIELTGESPRFVRKTLVNAHTFAGYTTYRFFDGTTGEPFTVDEITAGTTSSSSSDVGEEFEMQGGEIEEARDLRNAQGSDLHQVPDLVPDTGSSSSSDGS